MSEAELADAVRRAACDLESAVNAAVEEGLLAEIHVQQIRTFGPHRGEKVRITTTVTKPL